jgi:hypothetical protein
MSQILDPFLDPAMDFLDPYFGSRLGVPVWLHLSISVLDFSSWLNLASAVHESMTHQSAVPKSGPRKEGAFGSIHWRPIGCLREGGGLHPLAADWLFAGWLVIWLAWVW